MRTDEATRRRRPGRPRVAVILAVAGAICLAGCGGRPLSLYEGLQSGEHDVVARSAVKAGQQRDPESIPYLIDRLEDESPTVRVAAIGSLRRITGRDFGYSPLAGESRRREAVARWRQWLQAGSPDGEGG